MPDSTERAGWRPATYYPDPAIHALDPRFEKYWLKLSAIERLATGLRWGEGPVWFGDGRYLLCSDIPNNRILKWEEETGAVSIFRKPSNFANGHTRDRQGRLVGCEHGGRRVVRTEYDGSITVLVDQFEGKRLNSPNDVVVKSDGSIWFTDPLYGISNDYEGGRQASEQPPAVYRLEPETGDVRIVASDLTRPNGLAFPPAETRLYIAETGNQTEPSPRQYIRVFNVGLDGTTLSGGDIFHKIEPGYCDGMRVDEHGNIWSSAADGVHCISAGGELLGRIFVPHRVSNVTFGGPAKNRLFIGGSTTLYAIFLNRRGVQVP